MPREQSRTEGKAISVLELLGISFDNLLDDHVRDKVRREAYDSLSRPIGIVPYDEFQNDTIHFVCGSVQYNVTQGAVFEILNAVLESVRETLQVIRVSLSVQIVRQISISDLPIPC